MKTYAISDIHGCYDELLAAMKFIERNAGEDQTNVYFLGDYVDRGPRSLDVVKYLYGGPEKDNMKWFILKGNHDYMLSSSTPFDMDAALQFQKDDNCEEYLQFLRSRPLILEDDYRIYVHAGLLPTKNIYNLPDDVYLWIRSEFLDNPFDYGKLVVHGHTPVINPGYYPGWRLNVDTGCCFGNKLTIAYWYDDEIIPKYHQISSKNMMSVNI